MKDAKSKNWKTISESQYPWEREALAFIKERFPDHEPYRAWSNFEFIAEDGSVNEVDLLVFSPQGFFLIEIKSHPGRLSGDAGTWTFAHEGKRTTLDNPLFGANLKAKKLISLLKRQKAFKSKGRPPFLEALVFDRLEGFRPGLESFYCESLCGVAVCQQPKQPGFTPPVVC